MKTLLNIVMLYNYLTLPGSTEDLKPYINEFFFKISREDGLHNVQKKAMTLDFAYLRQVSKCFIIPFTKVARVDF